MPKWQRILGILILLITTIIGLACVWLGSTGMDVHLGHH
jgi:hypothetical protein